jgi:hypothetical protein
MKRILAVATWLFAFAGVNGVDYQVDYGYRIWAVNYAGAWFVIGRIVNTPYGTIAARTDGTRYTAMCQ